MIDLKYREEGVMNKKIEFKMGLTVAIRKKLYNVNRVVPISKKVPSLDDVDSKPIGEYVIDSMWQDSD